MPIKDNYNSGERLSASDFNKAAQQLNNLPPKTMVISQADYDALVAAGAEDPNTYYFIPKLPG